MHSSGSAAEAAAASSSGRYRALIAFLVVVLTAAGFAAVVPQLRASARHAGLIAAGNPTVVLDRKITDEFGMENPVVWVVEATHGTVWRREILTRIRDLTREVFTIPGVVPFDVIGLASPNMRELTVTNGAMRPEYLMAEVPQTPEAMEQLRRRVDGNSNYRGVLVSEDGKAAMVVANFRSEADLDAVGRAALALRDRYRDASTRVYATGGAVMGVETPVAVRPLVLSLVGVALVGIFILTVALGPRAVVRCLLAAVAACAWTLTAAAVAGVVSIPWTFYALFPTALLAAGVAGVSAPDRPVGPSLGVGGILVAGFAALAWLTRSPVRATALAGVAGAIFAVAAGLAAGRFIAQGRAIESRTPGLRLAAALIAAVALLGLRNVHTSFGLRGYGEHYLPAAAAEDLKVMIRHFPPPTALAIRVRGAAGFVQSPEVLAAFDGVAEAARNDPAVKSAMSLADVVKMIHRAFNGNRDEFLAIPQDRGLIARYLVLAYSPMFRRFVDRAFTRSTIWVYASSDRPADLARVEKRIAAQLAAHPVPNAEVDPIAGDGAVVLIMAHEAERLALGAVVLMLVVGLGLTMIYGLRPGAWCFAGGLSAGLVGIGAGGWLGVPIDLVSLPVFIVAAVAGAAVSALAALRPGCGWGRAAIALALAAVPALLLPYTAVHLVGLMLLAPATAMGMMESMTGRRTRD